MVLWTAFILGPKPNFYPISSLVADLVITTEEGEKYFHPSEIFLVLHLFP